MKEIDVTEDIFRLFRKMLSEVEGLKSIMSEDKENTFDPFKRIVLSPEGYKRFKEIDEAPLTEEKEKAIKKFVEETNEFYGTMEDKEGIHEKCGTNTPPKTTPEKPSVGDKKKSDLRTKEEIEQKITELEIVSRYVTADRLKIEGMLEALRWVKK